MFYLSGSLENGNWSFKDMWPLFTEIIIFLAGGIFRMIVWWVQVQQ